MGLFTPVVSPDRGFGVDVKGRSLVLCTLVDLCRPRAPLNLKEAAVTRVVFGCVPSVPHIQTQSRTQHHHHHQSPPPPPPPNKHRHAHNTHILHHLSPPITTYHHHHHRTNTDTRTTHTPPPPITTTITTTTHTGIRSVPYTRTAPVSTLAGLCCCGA